MITFHRTDSKDNGFQELVKLLDGYLRVIDGNDHTFYNQFNGIDNLKHVIVALHQGAAIGCGAIKEFDSDSMEVKRMFVHPSFRGKGLARQILGELERWANEMGYTKCVLETGRRMNDAVNLYKSCGYQIIPNFEPYKEMDNSVCFERVIG